MRLIFATNNAHKAKEVREILDHTGIEVCTLLDFPAIADPPEDLDTFTGNALSKAHFVFSLLDLPVIADDSGLEVLALGGRPGVRSKRYSAEATAEANNALLLRELAGVEDRRARFRCVLALVAPGVEAVAEGACSGVIGHAPVGEHGFGYDPLFEADALGGRTLAQATAAEKNAISHRGAAFRQLPDLLKRHGLL